jgi:uncharacterized protein YcbX
MPLLTKIFIYPIKSLGGIVLSESKLTRQGLQYDRRWMLVDLDGMFLTQRSTAKMALLQPRIEAEHLIVEDRSLPGSSIAIPLSLAPDHATSISTQVWDDVCDAIPVSAEADLWFSEALQIPCRLVYMPESTHRQVDLNYAQSADITSFSDGFPYLIASESSLQDLNSRLQTPVGIERFRPNLVVSGTLPWDEDNWKAFSLGNARFYSTKPCGRCQVITIDPQTAIVGKEPLQTLATFRRQGNKVLFGLNACWDFQHTGGALVKLGDELSLQVY